MKPLYLCILGPALLLACDGAALPADSAAEDVGEKEKKVVEPELQPAPGTSWDSRVGNNLIFDEDEASYDRKRVRITLAKGKIQFSKVNFSDGTVLGADGETGSAPSGLEISAARYLMEERWSTLKAPRRRFEVDWKIPFTVTVPGHKPIKRETQPFNAGTDDVAVFYEPMKTSGATVLWPGEEGPPTDPIPRAAAWTYQGFRALGPAPSVKSVRWVVVVDAAPTGKTRTCRGYRGIGSVKVSEWNATVRFVDRFTGTTHKEKLFKGRLDCPRSVRALAGSDAVDHYSIPEADKLAEWAEGQLENMPTAL